MEEMKIPPVGLGGVIGPIVGMLQELIGLTERKVLLMASIMQLEISQTQSSSWIGAISRGHQRFGAFRRIRSTDRLIGEMLAELREENDEVCRKIKVINKKLATGNYTLPPWWTPSG